MKWNLRSTNHLHDRWEILFRAIPVGHFQWIKPIDYPQTAKERIVQGLNGDIPAPQPRRSWTIADLEVRPGSWEIFHNGDLIGEITWTHPPNVAPTVWISRVLAGLNLIDRSQRILPPAPARPHRMSRAS